jgi:hypothetical protein
MPHTNPPSQIHNPHFIESRWLIVVKQTTFIESRWLVGADDMK